MSVRFALPGEPVCKGRPRMLRKGIPYTDAKTRQAEKAIGWAYREAAGANGKPLAEPVQIGMLFCVGTRRRKDLDNMVKLVMDALNGLAWNDDSQVLSIVATKRFEKPARTEVMVGAIESA
jgi:Holliday junction resolvase RusA-like endonuclease